MFCLLVLMCFRDKLGETQIKKIEEVERHLLLSSGWFANCYTQFFPQYWKDFILFRKRWEVLFKLRRNQDDVLIPLIKARRKVKQVKQKKAKIMTMSLFCRMWTRCWIWSCQRKRGSLKIRKWLICV